MAPTPRPALAGATPAARALLWPTAQLLRAGFGAAALARRTKVFHPRGVVYEATVAIDGARSAPAGAPLLSERATHRALVRFSGGIGLPESVADVLGIAIRLVGAHGAGRHQDLLLVTSAEHALGRYVFVPARSVWSRPYSSLQPYDAGGALVMLGARARRSAFAAGAAGRVAQLDSAAGAREPAFELLVSPAWRGPWRRVGSMTIGARLLAQTNAIRFNVWNTGGRPAPSTACATPRTEARSGAGATSTPLA
jgi:hypothetical protein